MQTITVYTLFDITNTDVVRPYKPTLMKTHPTINSEKEWVKARQQQKNYETLLQVFSLRAQPMPLNKPLMKTIALNNFNIKGKGKVWTFKFTVEHDSVYFNGIDELGLLKDDCENVPMILNLNESTKDEYIQVNKNIYLRIEKNVL